MIHTPRPDCTRTAPAANSHKKANGNNSTVTHALYASPVSHRCASGSKVTVELLPFAEMGAGPSAATEAAWLDRSLGHGEAVRSYIDTRVGVGGGITRGGLGGADRRCVDENSIAVADLSG